MNNNGQQQQQQQYERMSKSKKRRQRRKNSLLNRSVSRDDGQSQSEAEIDESDDVRSPDIRLEPAPDRLEVLRLKRIEHKYKVESPKELRRPKLKAKSKSLDDDDQLKIQELSEASESEEGKFQTNIIISEASSEETLLENSSTDVDRCPFALQLNDDNRIESVSPLTPEEERTLRNFLGGLNLVDSPEESAKDLYERTTNDPKTKKLLKRKELEEYFTPIAQNPRYLDAISEEASDLSDKEGAGGGGQHVKRSSPEQDDVENPILIETKVLEPEQGSVFNTKTDSIKQETAEVVYIDDSNSSISSNDCEDNVRNYDEEVSPTFEVELPSFDILHVETGESISTVLSSNTTSTKTILPTESAMQLTPPPTPTLADSKLKFDYTRIPNILKDKEPENSRKKIENLINEPKLQNVLEKKTVSAVHRTKKIVNGVVDKAEFRKVKVDEVMRNGDVEVDKDFEEHIYNSNSISDSVKDKPQSDAKEDSIAQSSKKTKEIDPGKVGTKDTNEHIIKVNPAKDYLTENSVYKTEMLKSSNLFPSETTEDAEVVPETESGVNDIDKQETESITKINDGMKKAPQSETKDADMFGSSSTAKYLNEFSPVKLEVRDSNEHMIEAGKTNNYLSNKRKVLNSMFASESTLENKDEGNVVQEKINRVYEIPNEDELSRQANTKEVVKIEPSNRAKDSGSDKRDNENCNERVIEVIKKNDHFHEDSNCKKEVLTSTNSDSTVNPTGNVKILQKEASTSYEIRKEDEVTESNKCNNHLIQLSNSINHSKEINVEEFLDTSSKCQLEEQCFDKTNKLDEEKETSKYLKTTFLDNLEHAEKIDSKQSNNYSKESTKSNTESSSTSNVAELQSFSKSESQRETVLRHVVMTSQDSNKTDSQKLKEFESIRQLNNEIQDKINKKELIGPIFRKSKSPKADIEAITSGLGDTLVMQCAEELPTKTFVQKRVKEFTTEHNTKDEEEEKRTSESHLVHSRIKTFSEGIECVDNNKTLDKNSEALREEGSILKRLLASHSCEASENLINIPIDVQRAKDNERIIPIEVDLKEENIIPITRDTRQKKTVPIDIDLGSITLEKVKKHKTVNKETEIEKNLEANNKEHIIQIKVEGMPKKTENKEINVPIDIDLSGITPEEIKKHKTVNKETEIEKKLETTNKEHIIPIRVEHMPKKIDEELLKRPNRKEYIIEVKIESSKKDDAKPVTEADIRSLNKSLQNMLRKNETSTCEKAKNEPPIPPPRRSKALLLKKQRSEEIPVSNDITYTNVVSPPRPSSTNSDSSSSEQSSKCTAKYNPNSSIGDVASIITEEQSYQVPSLRDIVLKLLVALPFGEEILKELAEVSKTIERYTDRLPFNFNSVDGVLAMPLNAKGDEERKKIVQLHERFFARRRHDREAAPPLPPPPPPPPSIGDERTNVTSPNRLLAIIKEEPNESSDTSANELEDNESKRLNARNLSEWLTLARHKSSSTSNLDCTSIPINNLRRARNDDERANDSNAPRLRRYSLPQEIYERQMIEIMEREREIQRELELLEEEKRKLKAEVAPSRRQQQRQREFQMDEFYVSKRGDFAERRDDGEDDRKRERPTSMPVFPTEFFRQQMYEEYMDKYTEREERKQQKVIKISSSNDLEHQQQQQHESQVKPKEIIHPVEIEREFMDKVKEKFRKHPQDDVEKENNEVKPSPQPPFGDDTPPPVLVLDGDKVKSVETLPRHLQEFVDDLTTAPDDSIWSPGQPRRPPTPPSAAPRDYQRTQSQNSSDRDLHHDRGDPVSPVWTPKSATSSPVAERKEFRPVNFKSPVLARKSRTRSETVTTTPDSPTSEPPWKRPEGSSDPALNLSASPSDRRLLPNSQSVPGLGNLYSSPRLPRAQNPTVTLLQKAREGQLPRGAQYIDQDRKLPNDRPPIKYPGEVLYNIKNEYTSESDSERPKRMAELTPRKFEGVGPTTKDGMPLILRSEVKEKDQSKWYKRMYDTIHKQKPHRDEFVTIRYKQKRAQYPYSSGYLSEPEPGAYDSDFTEYKYQTLDRRRTPQQQLYVNNNYNTSATLPRNVPDNRSYSSSDIVRNTQEKYHNQPGRIENYRPGHSSISEKEAKQHLEQQSRVPTQPPRSFMNQALKESGYESDSTLVFKRKAETAASQLGPREQREAYKTIQKGGDVPFQGLRKPAPERPKESPRKYVENEVTIHYKTPVRTEIKEYVSEDELAHRQAEAMRKIYEEERKRKYLQELQDMKSRRHTDNFIPSQKSPISLHRYDDFDDLAAPSKPRTRSPEPRLVAKALYNFVGQTARELTFKKGDLIYVRRQVDKNWYEGELNAMIGLFPVNYVEIVPYEGSKSLTPRKAHEGQARAKYNFVAQTHLELSLAKGELVTVTRRVDDNWFEGKIGGRKGIFPVAYVDVLIDPSDPPPPSGKPVASPAAHSLLLNGSAQGKESMGSHLYTPNLPNPLTTRENNGYHHAKPVQLTGMGTYSTLPKLSKSPIDQALHIETQSEPIPYRALYKYSPQNDDELELLEGDTVYVLEKCDDGWYVGSSERTGAFGTFPGNYVEKI